jgi:subtilisin family serine protease
VPPGTTSEPLPIEDERRGHGGSVLGAAVGSDGLGIAPEATWTVANPVVGGHLDPEALAAAVDWLLGVAHPDVVVVPWDVPDEGPVHQLAIPFGALRTAGAAVIFPAGNIGPMRGLNLPPANIESLAPDGAHAFSVGAVDEALAPYDFSCRGPNARDHSLFPRVAAPGVALAILDASGSTTRVGNGTSYSAGVAAGAAALVMAARPELTGPQVERVLEATARDLGDPGGDNTFGFGLVDVMAAIESPAPPSAPR